MIRYVGGGHWAKNLEKSARNNLSKAIKNVWLIQKISKLSIIAFEADSVASVNCKFLKLHIYILF